MLLFIRFSVELSKDFMFVSIINRRERTTECSWGHGRIIDGFNNCNNFMFSYT